jgi:phosphate transport system substrate-binding protein
VDSGDGCVKPSKESIQDGSYTPLARPIYMYPSSKSLAKPEVKAFMDFTIENSAKIAEAAKIVPMTAEQTTKAAEAVKQAEAAAGA